MKKLLHERLYAAAEDYIRTGNVCHIDVFGKPIYMSSDLANTLADEIGRCYIPRPRFEDWEPVQFGDEFVDHNGHNQTLSSLTYTKGGHDYVSLNGWTKQRIDGPVKRPEPKVLDADGVPTKKGDKVWDITQEVRDNPFWGGELLVVDVTEDNIVVTPSPGCGATMSAPSSCFSHTRPQYDCNGVLCKRGDIVFGLGRELHRYKVLSEELDVEKCEPYNHGRFTLPCLDLTEGDESVCFLDPRMVSHKEPGSYEELQEMLREESPKGDGDSYEKLRDDLKRKYGSNSQWVKRLTAIMERYA